MNNQTPFNKRDEASFPDGDIQFIGVDERNVFLAAGYVNAATNCRFRKTRAASRDGITILPWGPDGGLGQWGEVYGGFVFGDPNGVDQYFVIAADGGVWMTRPNRSAISVPLPQGVTLTAATFAKFIQANASIIMLRGFSDSGQDQLPLQLTTNADGSPDWETGFQVITQENTWTTLLQAATNQCYLVQHNLVVGNPVQFVSTTPQAKVVTVQKLTRLGTTATATAPGHGLTQGQVVTITGATPAAYNITATITLANANTFQYKLAADPGANATGTILATLILLPAAVTAGATYYVLNVTNANQFTISATPGGSQVTFNTSGTDTSVYATTMTVLDGAVPIPEAVNGIFTQNRLFLIDSKDTFLASDIGDFTRYVPLQNDFRINQGDPFTLMYLQIFNENTLICWKSGNVKKVTGISGDLSGAVGPLNVTNAYGMAAPSTADIGTDIYWLNSELRLTSLQLTSLNQEQGTDAALSDPLMHTFGRINEGLAVKARLAMWKGYLHLALPLDDGQIVDTTTDLVPAGTVYALNGGLMQAAIAVTPGQAYQWQAGPGDATLFDGGLGVTYQGDVVFTAAGSTVYITGVFGTTAGTPVASTINPVLASQCNTAVAVYDFLNKAWCGTDEALVSCPVDWLKFKYNGEERLAFIGADGYLHLYAEGYEDEQVNQSGDVYVDLFMDQNPFGYGTNAFDSVQINGGTVATQSGVATNGAAEWGVDVTSPGANLWQDANGTGGYNAAAANPWTAPNCTVSAIADGIRLAPTNGALPTIKINGTTVTTSTGIVTGLYGLRNYYFDWHSGAQIQPLGINLRVLTRALPCKSWANYAQIYTTGGRPDAKRFTAVALQLLTWNPSYTINVWAQGADRGTEYSEETKNYLAYRQPFGTPEWVPTNGNDDFGAPDREDYAYPETGAGIALGSGVNFDQMQEWAHRVPVDEQGLYVQAEILNTSGRLELVVCATEAQTSENLSGPN